MKARRGTTADDVTPQDTPPVEPAARESADGRLTADERSARAASAASRRAPASPDAATQAGGGAAATGGGAAATGGGAAATGGGAASTGDESTPRLVDRRRVTSRAAAAGYHGPERRGGGGFPGRAVRSAETVAGIAARSAESAAEIAARGAGAAAGIAARGAGELADRAGHVADRAGTVAERAVASVPRWSTAPEESTAVEYHNYVVVQRDSLAMGIVNASVPFLPVFVARLGGSDIQVGLLTALPALAGMLFAIPAAGFLRRRRNVVPLYSRSRMLANLAYAATALATFVVPGPLVVPAILAIWAIATIPATIGMVAFAVVMDGAAGPRGRYDLLSRRWSIMGLTTAISVVVIGQVLDALAFPVNYQLVFVSFSVAGMISFHYSSRIRLTDQEPAPPAVGSGRERARELLALVRAEPRFVAFVVRHVVYVSGTRLVLPLVPLYFVRQIHASDGWIGLIATAQSVALLAGYVVWRRQSRTRGPRFVLLAATGVAALAPAVMAFVRPEPLVAAIVAVGALFAAGTDLALFDELMKSIPKGQGLTFAAVDQSVTNAGGIIAPILGTALAGVIGIPLALVVGSAISVVGFALFALDRPGPGQRAVVRRLPRAPSAGRP